MWLIAFSLLALTFYSPAVLADERIQIRSWAVVSNSCAPWDGPAFDLRISKDALVHCNGVSEGSYFRIAWYKDLNAALPEGTEIELDIANDALTEGRAAFCKTAQNCTPVAVRVKLTRKGDAVTGELYESIENGRSLVTPFSAKPCPQHAICG